MRVVFLLPLVATFGCAHQEPSTTATASAAQPPAAQPSAAQSSAAQPSAAEPSTAEIASSMPKPAQLACAPIKVHFALDSDQLYDSEKPLLDTTAQCLRDSGKQRVTIVGNADERGPEAYNQDLGRRRAQTVATYLEGKGAPPAQIEAVVSHGEDSPICRESTLGCWQLNRRVAVRQSCHL